MSIFGVILVHIFPHSEKNNSEYGHFSRSVSYSHYSRNSYSMTLGKFLYWSPFFASYFQQLYRKCTPPQTCSLDFNEVGSWKVSTNRFRQRCFLKKNGWIEGYSLLDYESTTDILTGFFRKNRLQLD